jgi:predicted RNA binding protein YcfA (HicA-like mRNA interferase family)
MTVFRCRIPRKRSKGCAERYGIRFSKRAADRINKQSSSKIGISSRRAVKGKEAVRALQRLGFTVMKSTGSSHQMIGIPGTTRRVPVPVHSGRDLPLDTLRQILKNLHVDESDFYDAL